MYEFDTCEREQRAHWEATLRRLVQDALARKPGVGYAEFMLAIHPWYVEFRKSRRKHTALPPRG